ncbi:dynactin subunit 1 [Engraulis encrasicolus]|uniref:dynactin subunit 1 n=1 Tax=Engraulis encrasicolus TaxID=184585 RepID=UPI002FCF7EDC
MNWDNHLSSMLSAADGSVAKMRERLTTHGKYPHGRGDIYPSARELLREEGLDASPLPHPPAPCPQPPPSLSQPSAPLSPAVQWNDLAGLQAQLQNQSQMIESLSQSLRSMERDRHAQHRQTQILEEEVRRLRKKADEREREGERRGRMSPDVERRMEEWKREVTRELSSLRGHVNRSTSLGNLEESFSSKLRREEVELLRKEVDQLKSKMMRLEEDMFQQQSEARETRRQYERSCKMLEGLTDSYRTHSFDLARTISQYQNTQQEVRGMRVTVSELKDEVRGLILRDRLPPTVTTPTPTAGAPRAAVAVETTSRRQVREPVTVTAGSTAMGARAGGAGASPRVTGAGSSPLTTAGGLDSDQDYSPTPSLAEISSDDLELSWTSQARQPARRRTKRRGNPTHRSPGSDLSDAGSGLDDDDDENDESHVLRRLSDSPPDLSLSDL